MTTPSSSDYPEEFLRALNAVTNRRARVVIEHILKHGYITTEDLTETYVYNHPPRAVADVRDEGIPLERFSAKNAQGRAIAAYRFGNVSQLRTGMSGGRRQLPRKLKQALLQQDGTRCRICQQAFDAVYLQIDHRVPYCVAGDADTDCLSEWMLICASCNRAKSWSCEHCANWLDLKDPALCTSCYWGSPESYKHVALRPIRRMDIVWSEDEVEIYEKLKERAQQRQEAMPDYVKAILEQHVKEE